MSKERQYELIFVVAPDLDESEVGSLNNQVEEIVLSGGGRIDKVDNWGRRRLAYEIGRFREGVYVLVLFTGLGSIIGELDRKLKVSDKILRFLTVRVDEDFRKASRTAEKRKAESLRRNSAKGLPDEAVKTLGPSGQAVSEDTNTSVDPEGKVE
tara:strand:- start:89 stop:550 length:462 start_codon:yes stop_codon:yes gene_type:complete